MEPQNIILVKPSEVAEKLMCMLDDSAIRSHVLLLTVHYPKYPEIEHNEEDMKCSMGIIINTLSLENDIKACFHYLIELTGNAAGKFIVIFFFTTGVSHKRLAWIHEQLDLQWKHCLGLCPKRFDLVNIVGHDNKIVFSLKKNDAASRQEFIERINILLKVDVSSAENTRALYSYVRLPNRTTARSKHLQGS